MAGAVRYLTLSDVEAIHNAVVERTGSPFAPLRDRDLLENALMRPQHKAYYEEADLLTQGCTLIIAISQAQAFVDGNKRTAMQAGLQFLDLNGWNFTGDQDLLAVLIEGAAEKLLQERAIEELADWLRPQMIPR